MLLPAINLCNVLLALAYRCSLAPIIGISSVDNSCSYRSGIGGQIYVDDTTGCLTILVARAYLRQR